jgi:hypothetical protein
MAASPEDLLAVICPSLLTTSGYQSYLDVAEIRTSSSFFGGAYPLAVALRAAHMYTLNTQRGGQSGIVKSFGGIGVVRNELELSNYGQQLIGLIRASGPAITTTASDIYNSYLGRV